MERRRWALDSHLIDHLSLLVQIGLPSRFDSCKARGREITETPRPKVSDRNIDRHAILDMPNQTCCIRERNAPVATTVIEEIFRFNRELIWFATSVRLKRMRVSVGGRMIQWPLQCYNALAV